MIDKSVYDEETSKAIHALLRKGTDEELEVVYLVGFIKDMTTLTAADKYSDTVVSYYLGWQTAAFVGYCLIQEAILETTYKKVSTYLKSLAKRRDEIIKWMNESTFEKND